MTAKEYLSKGRELYFKIKNHELIIDNLKRLEQSIPIPQFDQEVVDHSRSFKTPFEKWIIMRIDWENTVKKEYEELFIIQNETSNLINKLNVEILRSILFLRYISFKDWTQISSELSFSESYIFQLHGKALKILDNEIIILHYAEKSD